MNIHEDAKTGEGVVTLTEHELHDVLADMIQNVFRPYLLDKLDAEMPLRIVIEPTDPDNFPVELVRKWEDRVERLLRLMTRADANYHDDAEYTC